MGYRTEPAELTAAASTITRAVARTDAIEFGTGSAEAYGRPQAHQAAQRFCSTWQVALALLGARAESAAKALTGAAEEYRTGDETSGRRFVPDAGMD